MVGVPPAAAAGVHPHPPVPLTCFSRWHRAPRRSTDARQSRKGLFAHPPAPRSFKTSGAQLMRDLLAIEVSFSGKTGCAPAGRVAAVLLLRAWGARLAGVPRAGAGRSTPGCVLCRSCITRTPTNPSGPTAPQVPITLNAAFCERHRRLCPPTDELERECSKVGAVCRCGVPGLPPSCACPAGCNPHKSCCLQPLLSGPAACGLTHKAPAAQCRTRCVLGWPPTACAALGILPLHPSFAPGGGADEGIRRGVCGAAALAARPVPRQGWVRGRCGAQRRP